MKTAATALLALAAFRLVSADESAEAVLKTEAVPKPSFQPTSIKGSFLEQFTDDWDERWTPSAAKKKTLVGGEVFSYIGKWSVEDSSNLPAIVGDKGLVAKSKAAHHAISAPFSTPLDPAGKPLVVQYEVKFQKGGNCGGGYLKLLDDGYQTDGDYNDKTPWVIMFGPDLTCPGTKVHFIFRHQNPITKEFEEKHLTAPPTPHITESTKLYTLIVNPDNTYEILIDDESQSKGSLLENFEPSVNPPKEIADVNDKKPEDWIDTPQIADPHATKPADWDEDAPYSIPDDEAEKPEDWLEAEPLTVEDPDAEKPEEWDDEEDGDWVAPTIPNPKCDTASGCGPWTRPTKPNPAYKGAWTAPMIDHPGYKGVWEPRQVANPDYFEDDKPSVFRKIGGVGFELWTMTEDILFDNIYVGHSVADAKALAKETFHVKVPLEKQALDVKKDEDLDEELGAKPTFKEDPLEWIRQQAFDFVQKATADPVEAVKSKPDVAAALVVVILTFFGSLGALFGLVGGKKPSAKKVDAPSKKVATPVATKETAATTTTEEKTDATKAK